MKRLVTKEEFESFLSKTPITYEEKIRWSTPIRWNYYVGDQRVAIKYDSFGPKYPEEYVICDE